MAERSGREHQQTRQAVHTKRHRHQQGHRQENHGYTGENQCQAKEKTQF